MGRPLVFALCLFASFGCATTPERSPLPLLPDDNSVHSYSDLLQRARAQEGAAHDAFEVDNWTAVSAAAEGLQQAAKMLNKATDVPANHKTTLADESDNLSKEALALQDAAKAKDAGKIQVALQTITLKIRELCR
jgi:hypothetical protein